MDEHKHITAVRSSEPIIAKLYSSTMGKGAFIRGGGVEARQGTCALPWKIIEHAKTIIYHALNLYIYTRFILNTSDFCLSLHQ